MPTSDSGTSPHYCIAIDGNDFAVGVYGDTFGDFLISRMAGVTTVTCNECYESIVLSEDGADPTDMQHDLDCLWANGHTLLTQKNQ
jgi:hypothetical protein